MVISNGQMVRISALFNTAFEKKVLKHLSEKFPEWGSNTSLEERQGLISEGSKRATAHKMFSPKEVTSFLEYIVVFGLDFENDPKHDWARKILKVRNIDGLEKISRLQKKHPL